MESGGIFIWLFVLIGLVWLITLFMLFRIIAGRRDLSAPSKIIWLLIIFMMPVLGMIAYFLLSHRAVKRKS